MVKNVDGKQIINSCREISWNKYGTNFIECNKDNPEICGTIPEGANTASPGDLDKILDGKCSIIQNKDDCNDNIFCSYNEDSKTCNKLASSGDICNTQDKLSCELNEANKQCVRKRANIANIGPAILLGVYCIFWLGGVYNYDLRISGGEDHLKATIGKEDVIYLTFFFTHVIVFGILVAESINSSKDETHNFECDKFMFIEHIDYICLVYFLHIQFFPSTYEKYKIESLKIPMFILFISAWIIRISVVFGEGKRGRDNYLFDALPYISNISDIFKFGSNQMGKQEPNAKKKGAIIGIYVLLIAWMSFGITLFEKISMSEGKKIMLTSIVMFLILGILILTDGFNQCDTKDDKGGVTAAADATNKCMYDINNSSNYEKININAGQSINIECKPKYEGGGGYKCVKSSDLHFSTDGTEATDWIDNKGANGYNPTSADSSTILKDLFPAALAYNITKFGHAGSSIKYNNPLLSMEDTSFIWDDQPKGYEINVSDGWVDIGSDTTGKKKRYNRDDNSAPYSKTGSNYVLHGNGKYKNDASKHLKADPTGSGTTYLPIEVCRPVNNCIKITNEAECEMSDNNRCSYVEGNCIENPDGKQPSKIIMCNDDSFRFFVTDSFGTIAWCIFVLLLLSFISWHIHPGKNKKTYFATGIKNTGIIVAVCLWMFITPNIISLLFLDDKACLEDTTNDSLKKKCEGEPDKPRKTDCELFSERCVYNEDDDKCIFNCSVNPFILLREIFLGPKDTPKRPIIQKAMHFIFKTLLAIIPYFILMKIIFKVAEKKGKLDNSIMKIGLILSIVILAFVPLVIFIESQSTHPSILKRASRINTDPSNIYCWVNNYGGIGPYLIYIIISSIISAIV